MTWFVVASINSASSAFPTGKPVTINVLKMKTTSTMQQPSIMLSTELTTMGITFIIVESDQIKDQN